MLDVHTCINGIGAYLPNNILTNDDLEKMVETNNEWIFTRTGIKERRISDVDTSQLGVLATNNLLVKTGIDPKEVDLIIFCTLTPDNNTPASACLVQKSIGAINATAFDINAACTGFVYGLVVADSLIKTGNYNKAIVIGAEVLSKIVDWTDRNTCVLFGDGAGAVLVTRSEDKSKIISGYTRSIGEKSDALISKGMPLKNYLVDESCESDFYIRMDGKEVFKFAVLAIYESVQKVLDDNNLSINEVKYIVPHQANERIIKFASEKLNVNIEKFYTNLHKYGNTSSASIPIALNEMQESGQLEKGDLLILVGFGGGLTYGSILIRW